MMAFKVWSYGAPAPSFGIEFYLRVETARIIHDAPEQKTHGLQIDVTDRVLCKLQPLLLRGIIVVFWCWEGILFFPSPNHATILAFSALGFGSSSLFCYSASSGVRTPSNRIELVRKTHHKNPFTEDQKFGRQHEDSLEKTSIGKTLGKVKSSSIGPA